MYDIYVCMYVYIRFLLHSYIRFQNLHVEICIIIFLHQISAWQHLFGYCKDARGPPVIPGPNYQLTNTLTCNELRTLIPGQCSSKRNATGIRKAEFRWHPDSDISKLYDLLVPIYLSAKLFSDSTLWFSVDQEPTKRRIKMQKHKRRQKESICAVTALLTDYKLV